MKRDMILQILRACRKDDMDRIERARQRQWDHQFETGHERGLRLAISLLDEKSSEAKEIDRELAEATTSADTCT